MLSVGLPDRRGTPQQRRAWGLLATAARSHRVWLIARLDRPASLRQWEAVSSLTARLALVPRWSARQMRQTLQDWLRQADFDAVICSHQRLWSIASQTPARLRVCDLGPTPPRPKRLSDTLYRLLRRWRLSSRPSGLIDPRNVLLLSDEADLSLVGQAGWARLVVLNKDPHPLMDLLQTEPKLPRPIRLGPPIASLPRAA